MNVLVDRWVVALGSLTTLLAASVPVAFWIQQEGFRQLSAGVSGDPGSPALLAYGRLSAGFQLLSQATPVLILATGFGVVALLVVLSHRWTAREGLRVREDAEADD